MLKVFSKQASWLMRPAAAAQKAAVHEFEHRAHWCTDVATEASKKTLH
jgi:hypothetical protein